MPHASDKPFLARDTMPCRLMYTRPLFPPPSSPYRSSPVPLPCFLCLRVLLSLLPLESPSANRPLQNGPCLLNPRHGAAVIMLICPSHYAFPAPAAPDFTAPGLPRWLRHSDSRGQRGAGATAPHPAQLPPHGAGGSGAVPARQPRTPDAGLRQTPGREAGSSRHHMMSRALIDRIVRMCRCENGSGE